MANVVSLGTLESVDPRTVWQHEAHDFTPWLLGHPDLLAQALGIDVELVASEHPVGGFSLDLLGRDLTNDCPLIVENQLAVTDHSHLGQLLTYAAGTDAATIVWIATEFRAEHRDALAFLNTIGGERARFFGLEIRAVRIDGSLPAPLLRVAVQPNDWHAVVANAARSAATESPKAQRYREFWAQYLEALHRDHPGTTNVRKPQPTNWLNVNFFPGGASLSLVFGRTGVRTELYIDSGNGEENLRIFRFLQARRDELERHCGATLEWHELAAKQACRISLERPGSIDADTATLDDIRTWFTGNQLAFGAAFRPVLKECRAQLAPPAGPLPHED